MVRYPNTGWNLVMTGTDRLDGGTGTSVVSQRSESGQGILSAKEGRGMWLWSDVEVEVLSSHMTTGDCSLAGHRDNARCLVITAISFYYRRMKKRQRPGKEHEIKITVLSVGG